MKWKIWWLIAAGVLLMGVGLMGAQAVLAAGRPSVPTGYDLLTAVAGSEGADITPTDIDELKPLIEGALLNWWALGSGGISTDSKSTTADVWATTGAFQDFHHMDMLYGSFLPRAGSGATAAVLDNNLAYRLFGTENAVGLEVKFQGRTFQVCGVAHADDSLLGLMSGNGAFRAWVSGYDLVATGAMKTGGVEAFVPRGVPGEGLAKLKAAMQDQGLPTSELHFTDRSDAMRLDAEAAAIPPVLLFLSAALILVLFLVRAVKGIALEAVAILRGGYFRDVWGAIAWRLGKLLLLIGAAAGTAWLLWANAGLDFYLPAKYIPGSWIDIEFWKDLIASESQAAVSAAAWPAQWWDTAYAASVALARGLNTAAVFGMLTAALSLRALWSDRRLQYAANPNAASPGLWDVLALTALAGLSAGVTALLTAAVGLPVHPSLSAIVVLAVSLIVWALAVNRRKVEKLLWNPSLPPAGGIPW